MQLHGEVPASGEVSIQQKYLTFQYDTRSVHV